jgi:hypothetical protein
MLSPLLFAANKCMHSISNTLRKVAVSKKVKATCPRVLEMRWIFSVRMVEWLQVHAEAVYQFLDDADKVIISMLPQLSLLLRPLFDLSTRCEGDRVTVADNLPLLAQIFLHYDDVREDKPVLQTGLWGETLHIVSGCLWWRVLHCDTLGQWALSYALTPVGRRSLINNCLPFLPSSILNNPSAFNRYPKLPLVQKVVEHWAFDDPLRLPFLDEIELAKEDEEQEMSGRRHWHRKRKVKGRTLRECKYSKKMLTEEKEKVKEKMKGKEKEREKGEVKEKKMKKGEREG